MVFPRSFPDFSEWAKYKPVLPTPKKREKNLEFPKADNMLLPGESIDSNLPQPSQPTFLHNGNSLPGDMTKNMSQYFDDYANSIVAPAYNLPEGSLKVTDHKKLAPEIERFENEVGSLGGMKKSDRIIFDSKFLDTLEKTTVLWNGYKVPDNIPVGDGFSLKYETASDREKIVGHLDAMTKFIQSRNWKDDTVVVGFEGIKEVYDFLFDTESAGRLIPEEYITPFTNFKNAVEGNDVNISNSKHEGQNPVSQIYYTIHNGMFPKQIDHISTRMRDALVPVWGRLEAPDIYKKFQLENNRNPTAEEWEDVSWWQKIVGPSLSENQIRDMWRKQDPMGIKYPHVPDNPALDFGPPLWQLEGKPKPFSEQWEKETSAGEKWFAYYQAREAGLAMSPMNPYTMQGYSMPDISKWIGPKGLSEQSVPLIQGSMALLALTGPQLSRGLGAIANSVRKLSYLGLPLSLPFRVAKLVTDPVTRFGGPMGRWYGEQQLEEGYQQATSTLYPVIQDMPEKYQTWGEVGIGMGGGLYRGVPIGLMLGRFRNTDLVKAFTPEIEAYRKLTNKFTPEALNKAIDKIRIVGDGYETKTPEQREHLRNALVKADPLGGDVELATQLLLKPELVDLDIRDRAMVTYLMNIDVNKNVIHKNVDRLLETTRKGWDRINFIKLRSYGDKEATTREVIIGTVAEEREKIAERLRTEVNPHFKKLEKDLKKVTEEIEAKDTEIANNHKTGYYEWFDRKPEKGEYHINKSSSRNEIKKDTAILKDLNKQRKKIHKEIDSYTKVSLPRQVGHWLDHYKNVPFRIDTPEDVAKYIGEVYGDEAGKLTLPFLKDMEVVINDIHEQLLGIPDGKGFGRLFDNIQILDQDARERFFKRTGSERFDIKQAEAYSGEMPTPYPVSRFTNKEEATSRLLQQLGLIRKFVSINIDPKSKTDPQVVADTVIHETTHIFDNFIKHAISPEAYRGHMDPIMRWWIDNIGIRQDKHKKIVRAFDSRDIFKARNNHEATDVWAIGDRKLTDEQTEAIRKLLTDAEAEALPEIIVRWQKNKGKLLTGYSNSELGTYLDIVTKAIGTTLRKVNLSGSNLGFVANLGDQVTNADINKIPGSNILRWFLDPAEGFPKDYDLLNAERGAKHLDPSSPGSLNSHQFLGDFEYKRINPESNKHELWVATATNSQLRRFKEVIRLGKPINDFNAEDFLEDIGLGALGNNTLSKQGDEIMSRFWAEYVDPTNPPITSVLTKGEIQYKGVDVSSDKFLRSQRISDLFAQFSSQESLAKRITKLHGWEGRRHDPDLDPEVTKNLIKGMQIENDSITRARDILFQRFRYTRSPFQGLRDPEIADILNPQSRRNPILQVEQYSTDELMKLKGPSDMGVYSGMLEVVPLTQKQIEWYTGPIGRFNVSLFMKRVGLKELPYDIGGYDIPRPGDLEAINWLELAERTDRWLMNDPRGISPILDIYATTDIPTDIPFDPRNLGPGGKAISSSRFIQDLLNDEVTRDTLIRTGQKDMHTQEFEMMTKMMNTLRLMNLYTNRRLDDIVKNEGIVDDTVAGGWIKNFSDNRDSSGIYSAIVDANNWRLEDGSLKATLWWNNSNAAKYIGFTADQDMATLNSVFGDGVFFHTASTWNKNFLGDLGTRYKNIENIPRLTEARRLGFDLPELKKLVRGDSGFEFTESLVQASMKALYLYNPKLYNPTKDYQAQGILHAVRLNVPNGNHIFLDSTLPVEKIKRKLEAPSDLEFVSDLPDPSQVEVSHQFNKHIKFRKPGELEIIGDLGAIDSFSYVDLNHNYSIRRMMDLHELGDKYDSRIDEYPWRTSHLTKGMERDAKIHTMMSTIRDWQYKIGFKGDPSLLSPQITKYGKNRHLNTTNPKEFPTIRLEGQSFESLSARERASHFIPDKDIDGNPILPLGNYHRPGLIFREDAYNIMMGSYDSNAHQRIREYQMYVDDEAEALLERQPLNEQVFKNINDMMTTPYDGYALNLENRTLLDDILSNKYNDFFDIFERSTKKSMMQAQYIIENSALGQIPMVEELRPMAGMMGNAPVRSGPEPVISRDFRGAGAGWNIFDYVRLLESNGNDQTYEGFLITQLQKNTGTQRTLDWHDYINKTVGHSRLSLLESILTRNDSVLDALDMDYLRIHENTFRDLSHGTQDLNDPLDAMVHYDQFNKSMKPLLESAKTTVESSAYSNWMEDLYKRFLLPEGVNREVRHADILDKFTGKNGVINGTGDWDDPINSVSMLLDHAVMFNRYVEMLMQEYGVKKGLKPSRDYVDAIDRASRMSPDEGLYTEKLLRDLGPSELRKREAKNKHTAERNKLKFGVSHQEYPLSDLDPWAGGVEDQIELVPKFSRNPYKNSFTMGRIREWIWNNYADANASKHGKSIAELFEGYRKWVREYHSKTKPDQTPRNYMGDFVSNEKPVGRYSEYIRNRQTSFQQQQLAQKELLLKTSLGMDNAISRAFNLERTTDYVKNSFYDNYVADLNKKGIRAGSHNSQQRYQDSSFMSRAPILFAREAEDAERMVVEGTNRYTTIDNGARPNPKSADYEDGAEEIREAYDIEKGGGFEFKRVTDPWEDSPKDKDGKSIGKLNGEDIDQLSSPLTDAQMELQKRIDILKKINEEIGDAPVESPKKAIAKSIQKVNKDYYEIEWGGEKDHVPKYVADIIKKDGAITSTGELSRQATDEIANAWRGRVTSWVSRERKLRDATQSELARKRKKPAAIFAQDPYNIKRLPIIAKAQGEAQIETTVTTPEMTKTEFYAVFKSGWDKIADISVRDNYYQAGTARRFADGLRKLLGIDADITKARAEWKRTKGQILTSGELDALEVVFGKEIIDELAKAQRSSFGNLWDFVVGVWNIPRSVMSSIDFSGLLRQGGILLAPYPKEWGASIGPALKAMLSEGNMHKVNAEMESHPLFKYFQDVGELYFARDTLYEREEAFISGIANKIPGISHSSRFHATFLNALRFKSMLAAYKKMISEGYKHDTPKMNVNVKQYAKFVNYATGRGDLGKIKIFGRETGFDLNKIAPVTNGVFWSARLFVSRYQVPLSILMAHNAGAKWARNTIIFDLVKTSALIGMVIGMMKAGGADVQDDPESTDFGKGKWGPQRIDLNAGYGNIISNTWKIISGKTTNAQGDSLPVYGGRGNQLLRFLKSKTSPQFNIALDMIRGRNYYGEDIDLADPDSLRNEAGNRFVPLALQEVREAVNMPGTLLIGEGENWKNESVGWLSLLSFVGGGSNSYHTKEDLSEAVFGRGYNQLWPYERKIVSAGIEMGGQYQPDKWTMLLSEQEYLEFQALKKLGEQYEASIKAPRTETRKQLIRQVSDEFFEIRRDFRKQNDMIYKLQARENEWDIDNDERQDIVYHAPNEDPNVAVAWTRYKQIAREYEAAGEGEQLRVRGEDGIWARFEQEVAPNVSELQLNYLYANINYKAIPEEILKHKDLYDAISTLGRFVKSEEARNIIDRVHAQDYPEGVTPNEAPDRYRFNQPRIEAIEQRYPEIADPNALQ